MGAQSPPWVWVLEPLSARPSSTAGSHLSPLPRGTPDLCIYSLFQMKKKKTGTYMQGWFGFFPFPNCCSSSKEENSPLIGSIPGYISDWKYKGNMGKEKSAVQHER